MINKEDFADKAATVGNTIQYSGATGSIIAGLALSEIGVIVGIVIAIFGFFINWYYKHKSYKLQEKRHKLEAQAIKDGKLTISNVENDNG